MNRQTGTAKELNLKPGDVVFYPTKNTEHVIESVEVLGDGPLKGLVRLCLSSYGYGIFNNEIFRIISRASDDTPKLWRDMNRQTGTLKELNLKPGDVVECVCVKEGYKGVGEILTINGDGVAQNERINAFLPACDRRFGRKYRILGRRSDDTPKLWRDMSELERANVHPDTLNDPTNPLQIPWGVWTREAKGAVLLAHHEGKMIEALIGSTWMKKISRSSLWADGLKCRVKPEPVRETVELWWRKVEQDECSEGRIGTIVLEDSKPDRDSIKMEEI